MKKKNRKVKDRNRHRIKANVSSSVCDHKLAVKSLVYENKKYCPTCGSRIAN